MSDQPGIVIAGPSGRMGRQLVATVAGSDRARLAGVLTRPGHDWVGQDVGTAMGSAVMGVTVGDDPSAVLAGAAAVIDFTAPDATVALAGLAAEAGVAHVIGTTGMSDDQLQAIETAAARIPIVRAGNMSLGVNLLVSLSRQVAAALDADYDIEVVEAHHRHKVDAPSGTALMLGEAAAAGRGMTLSEVAKRGRDGITGARPRGEIGFAAIRGGDIVGEHDISFAGPGERVVLRHVASDRSVFSRGALTAALWAIGQAPGHYAMTDVLGL